MNHPTENASMVPLLHPKSASGTGTPDSVPLQIFVIQTSLAPKTKLAHLTSGTRGPSRARRDSRASFPLLRGLAVPAAAGSRGVRRHPDSCGGDSQFRFQQLHID